LGDLGSTKIFRREYEHYTHPLGTKGYYAPEMYEYKPYTKKTDVWGLGLILHEMCGLKKTFFCNDVQELTKKNSV